LANGKGRKAQGGEFDKILQAHFGFIENSEKHRCHTADEVRLGLMYLGDMYITM
jgi:hypothetical protein